MGAICREFPERTDTKIIKLEDLGKAIVTLETHRSAISSTLEHRHRRPQA